MIAIGRDEHLRFVTQAAESNGVNDAVAITLKNIARPANVALRLGMKPATTMVRKGSIRGQLRHVALMPPTDLIRKRLFCFQRANGLANLAFPHESITATLFIVAFPLLRRFQVRKRTN